MDANDLNKRLKELMDGLSVKVRAAQHLHTRMPLMGEQYGCAGSYLLDLISSMLGMYARSS